ncbi:fibrinogen binding protein [Vibrio phage Seahorse]|uniref:Fibrinogen binding protein n=1 Tax=Vibrio phage Seahorse TaxID=2662136 RepID=A0A6B7SIT7_9CAUD|nr:fibrinogen binding protein [Vibrio phage Seahorse]QGF20981.1 fibrinogen binding protein [Vibrio phage Seahorse]
MSNELVAIEPKNVLTLFTETDQLEEIIKQVEMEVATFEHDLSNDARRKKTASLARKVASTKTYLDGLGKDLVADWKAKSKAVDANRKMMRDRLDDLRDKARKPLTDWEEEQKRIEEEKRLAEEAEKLRNQIESDHEIALLLNEKFDRKLEEKRKAEEEAERQRKEAEEKARVERERQIAEEARIKVEQEAKDREERLERERQEAIQREEQAKREAIAAEERRKAQEEENERQRKLAEEKARRDAEEAAERARQAEIKRQHEEQERQRKEQEQREADKRHIGAIRKAAKESLMTLGLDEQTAREIVLAIHNGQVANVKINY